MGDSLLERRAAFHSMQEGSQADWDIIVAHHEAYARALPDRALAHLRLLEGDHGGFAVDRLTHSLQSATLAARDGRDDEYVICALFHDVGDTLCPHNHPEIAAAMLRPFVSDRNHFMVAKHGIFQGVNFWHYVGMDPDAREEYRGHEFFDPTAEFCELYDQAAFDPSRETLPLEHFEPMVRDFFSKPLPLLIEE